MPETGSVESVHLGPLAQLAVQREEPLDLVLLEVRFPRESVHQLGLLFPDNFAYFRHSPGDCALQASSSSVAQGNP